MQLLNAEPLEIHIEPIRSILMKGMGYGHPEWGHGQWKGELAISGESWDLNQIDPLAPENIHIQEVVRVHNGVSEGVGVLEQLVVGPYPRYGFTKFFDAAT